MPLVSLARSSQPSADSVSSISLTHRERLDVSTCDIAHPATRGCAGSCIHWRATAGPSRATPRLVPYALHLATDFTVSICPHMFAFGACCSACGGGINDGTQRKRRPAESHERSDTSAAAGTRPTARPPARPTAPGLVRGSSAPPLGASNLMAPLGALKEGALKEGALKEGRLTDGADGLFMAFIAASFSARAAAFSAFAASSSARAAAMAASRFSASVIFLGAEAAARMSGEEQRLCARRAAVG